MKKFIYRYNLEMLSVYLIAMFLLTLVRWDALSFGRRVIGIFALLIMLHEWEELRFPGGFFEMIGGQIGVDVSMKDMGKCHLPTKLLIFVFVTVPMIFDSVAVLVIIPILLMILELFAHVMAIFRFKRKKLYSPGLVTGAVMGVFGIWSLWYLFANGMASASDLLIAIPVFFVCFMTMNISILKLMEVDVKETLRKMTGN